MAWGLQLNGSSQFLSFTAINTNGAFIVSGEFTTGTLSDHGLVLGSAVNNENFIGDVQGNGFYARIANVDSSGQALPIANSTRYTWSVERDGANLVTVTLDGVGSFTFTAAGTVIFDRMGRNNFGFYFDGLLISTVANVGGSPLYNWDSTVSDHSNTGLQPVIDETLTSNDATGSNFPTDGSAWVDLGGVTETITISSPTQNQLFSRDKLTNLGDIVINGTYTGSDPLTVEVSYDGGSFVTLDSSPLGGTFSGTLSGQVTGNGDLTVRYSDDVGVTDTVPDIAIGVKCLFWGQSNFVGVTNNVQSYTGTSGFFKKYTVLNDLWEEGDDPFTTSTSAGSLFPILANLLVASLGVPVAFIGVAQNSTSLAMWQAGQTYNDRMLDYITDSGGSDIEIIASWIGETDAQIVTPEGTFKSEYNAVIDQLEVLTGTKSVLCGIAQVGVDSDNVRQWIQDIVASNANALQYVDMAADFTRVHYETDQETADVAQSLFNAIELAFFASVLNLTITGIPDGTFMTVLDEDDGTRIQRQNETYTSENVSIVLNVAVGTTVKGYVDDNSNPSLDGAFLEGITE